MNSSIDKCRYIIILFIFSFHIHGQSTLWGLTSRGGTDRIGLLFGLDSGKNQSATYSLINYDGRYPYGDLLQASNGKLYGTTVIGGTNNGGVLFDYDPVTGKYTVLFNGIYGGFSTGNLIEASDGKLYGITVRSGGGTVYNRTIFSFDPVTNTYSDRYDFALNSGYYSANSLTEGPNGKLYGISDGGGLTDGGALFEFDPATSVFTEKHSFSSPYGTFPLAGLLLASNGKFYGTTYDGAQNLGTLYEYDPATQVFVNKLNFPSSVTGEGPRGTLIQGSDGLLYGMTERGGAYDEGVIYSFDITTDTYTKRYDFDPAISLGFHDNGNMVQATDGKMYGIDATTLGGIIFSFDPATNVFTKKLDFTGSAPGVPYANSNGLIQASDGLLYGMADGGGFVENGVMFKYDPVTNIYTKILDFDNAPLGSFPQGSLLVEADTLLYGLTYRGGNFDKGTIFSYVTKTNIYTKKYNFNLTASGMNPYGSLMKAADGKYYAMASSGGSNNQGTIFSYDPVADAFSKKIDLSTLSGSNPYGSLMQAPNGLLYGLTSKGGSSSNYGSLFSYNTTTNTYTMKVALDSLNQGSHPFGDLVLTNNKLYGLTSSGGSSGKGTLFSYDYSGNMYTNLKNLDLTTGSNPTGSLVLANNGLLYGLTSSGGTNNQGTLFSFNPTGIAFTKIIDFTTLTGFNSMGSLRLAANGKLYGMTNKGGTSILGTVFEFDPATNIFTKTIDFDGINGSSPTYGNLVEICLTPKITLQPKSLNTCIGTAFQLNTTATGRSTYQWYANGISITGASRAVLTVAGALPGNTPYLCKVTNECGTITTTVATVTGYLPTITGNVLPALVCQTNPATILGIGASIISITGGITSGIGFIPTASGITIYTLTGTDANQCKNTAILALTVNGVPNITITSNTSICSGFSSNLTVGGANTYSWNTGSVDSTITVSPTATTAYQVTATGTNGCSVAAVTIVTVNSLPPITITGKTSICIGSETILSATGGNTYIWNTNATTTSINVSPIATTAYAVTATGANGCLSAKDINITVNDLPIVSLDLSHINNTCDTLSPVPLTGGYPTPGTYWYNNNAVLNLNTSIAGTYPILYRYTNQNGCVNTASGVLTSIHCTVPGICERPDPPCHCTNTCPPPFKVYTGITLNGDGRNDTWVIDSLPSENTVTILDKWGNEVYHKANYTNDWDGKQNGNELPAGVYYYILETGQDKKRFAGTVSIIR